MNSAVSRTAVDVERLRKVTSAELCCRFELHRVGKQKLIRIFTETAPASSAHRQPAATQTFYQARITLGQYLTKLLARKLMEKPNMMMTNQQKKHFVSFPIPSQHFYNVGSEWSEKSKCGKKSNDDELISPIIAGLKAYLTSSADSSLWKRVDSSTLTFLASVNRNIFWINSKICLKAVIPPDVSLPYSIFALSFSVEREKLFHHIVPGRHRHSAVPGSEEMILHFCVSTVRFRRDVTFTHSAVSPLLASEWLLRSAWIHFSTLFKIHQCGNCLCVQIFKYQFSFG